MARLLPKKTLIVVVVLVVCGAIAWSWHGRNRSEVVYSTASLKRGDVAATITATGTIEPVEAVDVGAQVAGRIRSFGPDRDGKTVDYGSVIEEGAVLARIDDSVYAADLAVAKAQLERDDANAASATASVQQAKAKFLQAEAAWKRARELDRSNLLAASDYDSANADYQVAKANVSVAEAALVQAKAGAVQARAALDKAQRNVDFCTIRSPVSGVVIDRRVNIGQTVVASLNAPSLFLIARDLTRMQIWAAVNEADVGRIAPGSPVTFTVDAFPGRAFQGTVGKVRLNATMNQNVVLYTVEVDIDNSSRLLLPYLTANVRFVLNRESGALLVPNPALRWSPSSLAQISPDARPANPSGAPDGTAAAGPESAGKAAGEKRSRGTLWIKDGEFVRPVEVTVGTTDGVNTAVDAQGLREGLEVVTGDNVAAAQADSKNPFLPRAVRR